METVTDKLRQLAEARVGDDPPRFMKGTNGWGDALSDLAREALEAIPRWRPIETAPVLELHSIEDTWLLGQKNYRFECLLKDRDRRVCYGWGYYIKPPFRDTDTVVGQVGLRWRSVKGDHLEPEYWMPLPRADL